MAITSAICNSFKTEILQGVHNFTASTGDTFNLALYTSSATLGAGTTAYTTSNEVSGTGYTAKGKEFKDLPKDATFIDITPYINKDYVLRFNKGGLVERRTK